MEENVNGEDTKKGIKKDTWKDVNVVNFIKENLGIELFEYQKLLLNSMGKCKYPEDIGFIYGKGYNKDIYSQWLINKMLKEGENYAEEN